MSYNKIVKNETLIMLINCDYKFCCFKCHIYSLISHDLQQVLI